MPRQKNKPINGIDDLFAAIEEYRKSGAAKELLDFVVKFPSLAPFNAMLVHMQKRGARMVATAQDWKKKYGRVLKFNARPLVILWPFGPVNFVYDISDTSETEHSVPIPQDVIEPFLPEGEVKDEHFRRLMENLPTTGVVEARTDLGSQMGGAIGPIFGKYYQIAKERPVKVLYGIQLNANVDPTTNFTTLIHELGHLYCGHLAHWVPDKRFPERMERINLSENEWKKSREFEAEAVCWLVSRRLGIKPRSESYLAGYWRENTPLPAISLETILLAASRLEALCTVKHAPPKELRLDPASPEFRSYIPWK